MVMSLVSEAGGRDMFPLEEYSRTPVVPSINTADREAVSGASDVTEVSGKTEKETNRKQKKRAMVLRAGFIIF
jgi:hypothetical protein